MRFLKWTLLYLLLPSASYASFIETTMGTAVVNDATAAYFNPAALILLKNSQIIPLGTVASFRTQFNGQTTAVANNLTQSGSSSSTTNFNSLALYMGAPISDYVTLGFAAVSNTAMRDPEDNSILRYVQSSNSIQDYDVVPSLGVKLNKYLSLGGGVNFSQTNFNLHPINGFPGSNIADSQSNNQSDGSGVGANAGFLFQPRPGTVIGFNYRSVTTYNENGTSVFNGATQVVSNNYHFILHTPARSVLSISQLITPAFGLITTIQRIQWGITKNINVYGIANASGTTPVIANASIPYYLHNTWVFTLGAHYRFNPTWIIRAAATYNQSPDNGYYQVSTGDSTILGGSVGYTINKTFTIDGGYAHAFIQNQSININGSRFLVLGTNQAARDVVSLKLTINV